MDFLLLMEQYPAVSAAFIGVTFGSASQLLLNWFSHRNIDKREKFSERRRGRFEFYRSLSNRLIDLLTAPQQNISNINDYIKIFNEMHICASSKTLTAVRALIDSLQNESRKQHTWGRDLCHLACESIEIGWTPEKTAETIKSQIEWKFSGDYCLFNAQAAHHGLTLNDYDCTIEIATVATFIANIAGKAAILNTKNENIDSWLSELAQEVSLKVKDLNADDTLDEMQNHYYSLLIELLNDAFSFVKYQARANQQLTKIYIEMRKDVGLPDEDHDKSFSLHFVKLSPSEKDAAKREAKSLLVDLLNNRTYSYFLSSINTDLQQNQWAKRVCAFRDNMFCRPGLNTQIIKIPSLLIDLAKIFSQNSGVIDSSAERIICKIYKILFN